MTRQSTILETVRLGHSSTKCIRMLLSYNMCTQIFFFRWSVCLYVIITREGQWVSHSPGVFTANEILSVSSVGSSEINKGS